MADVVVIQRVVPHYRVPIFAELYRRYGWRVATAEQPQANNLSLADPGQHAWLQPMPIRLSPRSQYRAMVPLAAIRRTMRPEAILAEFSLQMSSSWDLAIRRRGHEPFAFWSQGWNRERGFHSLKDSILQSLRLRLLARADAQLCYSADSAEYLRAKLGDKMPIFVAHNALAGGPRQVKASQAPRDALLYVGRLTHGKRIEVLIDAFRTLQSLRPTATLTVVGDGPDRAALEALATGTPGVRFAGAVYDDEALRREFDAAGLFVVPGSAGLSVNEALMNGLPVMLFEDHDLIRHHPEHQNVVPGQTGYRIPGTDAAALAAALCQVMAEPQDPRTALGSKLGQYVAGQLSVERMLEGFAELNRYFDQRLAQSR